MGKGQQEEIRWAYGITIMATLLAVLFLVSSSLSSIVFIGNKTDLVSENNAKNMAIVGLAICPIALVVCILAFIKFKKLNNLYEAIELQQPPGTRTQVAVNTPQVPYTPQVARASPVENNIPIQQGTTPLTSNDTDFNNFF